MMKNTPNENIVEFQGIEEFYFPKNCIICGDETENRIEKTEFGSFTSIKDYKIDYKFELPICDECNSKINLKAGKSGIILLLSILLGISLGIMLYFLTYSIILGVAVFTVLFTLSYLKYRAKIRPRIKLSDFLQMKVIPNEEHVHFTFTNKEYAKYVNKINSEKIKEKEETATVEKTQPLATNKKFESIPAKESKIDSSMTTSSGIPPTKYISKIKEETEEPILKEIPPIIKKCPKCGSDLKAGWKFCVSCSEKIE